MVGVRGPRTPSASRITIGSPVIRCTVPWSTAAARTRTSTSPFAASGSGTSRSSSRSGPPYLSCWIAFIAPTCLTT